MIDDTSSRAPGTGPGGGAAPGGDKSAGGSATGGSARQSTTIAAPLSVVMDTIADFERYPEWVSAIRSAEVLSRDDDGRPVDVAFVLVAGIVDDEYRLRYEWSSDPAEVRWTLAEPSILQKRQSGSYELAPAEAGEIDGEGEATVVTYSIDVELTVDMLGRFRDRARRRIITAALEDLAARVEER
ncbi:SRPBCC family protein [Dietzia sp.]|uniref:SRPBCC family protein n=1 Tax=Dietzia sp. TaxID=1871616 RepID=UPI002FDB131C